MAFLREFGLYLPERVVLNDEVAAQVGVEAAWILQMSGIEERRFAAPGQTVAELGTLAARNCLERAGMQPGEIGMILVSSGTGERRFPGPAATIGGALGLPGVPAIDLPMASAGSLFGIALATHLAPAYGNVLVVGSEIMSRAVNLDPESRDTAILFGDGAGACVVSRDTGFATIADSLLASDGAQSEALQLPFDGTLRMDGRTVIMHVSRKLPRVIADLLERNQCPPNDVGCYLLHQANRNLLTRVAQLLRVPDERFYCNVDRYGNTSSASLLIAGTEWRNAHPGPLDAPLVLAAFGAGLNWGAVLAR